MILLSAKSSKCVSIQYAHTSIHSVDGQQGCSWADVMAYIDDRAELSSIFTVLVLDGAE